MSQKVIRCPDDKLALLLEHGGLNCTSEAKAVAHGIMLDLRDCRAALAAAEAKLADERRHADALVEALTKFMWAASPEQHGGTSAYPYEELRDLLAAHAARRAAAAPLSDAGASSEVANGTA